MAEFEGWSVGDRVEFVSASWEFDLETEAKGTVIGASLYGTAVDVRFDDGRVVYDIPASALAGAGWRS